ncbi:MAG: hypothetical protein HFH48_00325 [Lachnospiraceae bacterium]|nr:hypothetical protein [Lachnospiraceae bacterium]
MKRTVDSKEHLEKITKIFTICVLLFPILTIYATPIPQISFGEIVLFSLMLVMSADMACRRRSIKWNPFWCYLFYALCISIAASIILLLVRADFSYTDMMQRVLRDGFYFAIVLVFGAWYFDFDYGKKIIRLISIVFGLFMILQVAAYAAVHVYVPGVIPQLETTISGGFTGAELTERFALTASVDGYARASGFFSEPAVAAHFMTVALLLELFPENQKVNYKLAGFYSTAMLLTFSVNAYVAILGCWGLWAVYSDKYRKNDVIRIVFFAFAFCVIAVFAMRSNAIAGVVNRLIELKNGGRTEGSSVIRVVRGMAFYLKMPLFCQLFGSGFGNFIQFREIFAITTVYETADEYMNTNAYILVSSGAVGLLLFIGSLLRNTKGKIVFARMLLILLFIFGLSSSIYSSAQFVIMLLFIMYAPPEKGRIYEN